MIREEEEQHTHLDESSPQEVDREWIDTQEDRWREHRSVIQALERRGSDPADASDLAAARAWVSQFPLGCSAEHILATWQQSFEAQRRDLERTCEHLRERLSGMDPRLPEHRYGEMCLRRARDHMRRLPHLLRCCQK